MTEYTKAEMEMMGDPGIWEAWNRWLAAGKGVAVYQNQDMNHPELGHKRFASFGTPEAQFEDDEPPKQLPDFPGEINWRYQLIGTYRGEPVGA